MQDLKQIQYLSKWIEENKESPSAGKLLAGLFHHAMQILNNQNLEEGSGSPLKHLSDQKRATLKQMQQSINPEIALSNQELILEICSQILKKDANNSLSTPTKSKKSSENSGVATAKGRFRDLRGVQCPMNFVKAKLELAKMQDGQELELWLDSGQPIENVPRSMRYEGHKVLKQTKVENHYVLLIKKVSSQKDTPSP